jgi:SAM-dependent methyltransferase
MEKTEAGTQPSAKAQPAPERLLQFTWGYAPLLIIEAAISQGVFEALNDSAMSVEALAARTGASPRGLRAILNALVGFELLEKQGDAFALTPESAAFLVPGQPGYHGGIFHHHVRQVLPRWLQLREAVATGRPAAARQGGSDEEHFARFVEALFAGNYGPARRLGEHLRIPSLKAPASVLDLGAGSGVWGIALAELSPQVTIHAVDYPKVLEVTRRVAARRGVASRLRTIAGDLFHADFGSGHSVAIIGHVLHSEGPGRSRELLAKTFQALAPEGTVVVCEFIPNDDRTGPPRPLIFAVNMLVHNEEGDTFTVPEMSAWLSEAGFVNIRLLDVSAASPLLLADKPPQKTKQIARTASK